MALLTPAPKNAALQKIAASLSKQTEAIEQANQQDLGRGERKKLGAKLDRIRFNRARILASSKEVLNVARLPDPVGRVLLKAKPLRNFSLQKVSVPLGVIAIIYESRPNVTVDAAVLALKAGNAVLLRGSRDAQNSNRILLKIMRAVLAKTAVPPDAVQLVDSPQRAVVGEILRARGAIDLVIPRGGKSLIDFVVANAQVPVIETGASVVHLFVDQEAELEQAVKIALNSKLRRTAICNALDTLVLHCKIAQLFLTKFIPAFQERGGILHAEKRAKSLLPPGTEFRAPDFTREWLSPDLNLKVVGSLTEAIKFIQMYSLGHTDAICSRNKITQERFLAEVDSACVYANLSTQFSDGAEFGLGAEIGISTQKLHARGPFALESLVSYKWVGRGKGEVRV